jgi:DNA polymerase III subunit epsilon
MSAARELTFTAIDFEGTGALRGYPDQPWQIGVVQIVAGQVDMVKSFEHLLHVGERPFNRHAPGRHEEVREELLAAPNLALLWPALRSYLDGIPLVAHNVATERRYLSGAFALHVPVVWLDTLKLAKLAYPGLASHKLEDVLLALGLVEEVASLVPGRTWHDAFFDAVGCAVLLCHLLQQPGWDTVSLGDLIHLQRRKVRS